MANILIIEDDEDIRNVLKKILETDGHCVTVAPNGVAGIELYRKERNEIIITDMIMPGMEGVETILHIRSDCPDAKIIAISGGGPALNASTCLKVGEIAGAVKTLAKPFGSKQIIDAVRELVDKRTNTRDKPVANIGAGDQ
jgi:CheY-like chemotaxis protein